MAAVWHFDRYYSHIQILTMTTKMRTEDVKKKWWRIFIWVAIFAICQYLVLCDVVFFLLIQFFSSSPLFETANKLRTHFHLILKRVERKEAHKDRLSGWESTGKREKRNGRVVKARFVQRQMLLFESETKGPSEEATHEKRKWIKEANCVAAMNETMERKKNPSNENTE